jgi:hypothetical protein
VKPTYSNDRSAPRMKKGEFSKLVITKDLYKKFLKQFPEHKEMTWKEFYQNWLDIAERIRYEAIYNPLGVKLGSYIGELKLQYLPYKFEAKDHKSSAELGEKVNYLNIDSRGKVPKIKWERREAVKRNKILQFYAFDETRELNRLAFGYVEQNPHKLRTARVTLGGHSVWRQKIKKK